MLTIEPERELGMVDAGWLPAVHRVTGSAVGSQLAIVCIVCTVAGNTAHGGALEDAILMAALTGY